MKLRNLLIASAGMLLLGACSSSDEPDAVANKSFDAVLSIAATPNNGITTKADDDANALTNEAFINTLTAYVFDASGNLAGSGVATATNGQSVDEVLHITVKVNAKDAGYVSTDKFDVFLLANATPNSTITSESQLKDAILSGDISSLSVSAVTGGTKYIPMFSKVIKGVTGLVAGKTYNNWALTNSTTVQPTTYAEEYTVTTGSDGKAVAGTTVYAMPSDSKIIMNRYVARVQLESLGTNFEGTLEGSQFKLTNVSLANVSGTSLLIPASDDAFSLLPSTLSYFRGYPESITRADYLIANGTVANTLSKTYTGIVVDNSNSYDFTTTTNSANMAQFYAFEHNSSTFTDVTGGTSGTAYTMLIITGDITNSSTGITQKDVSYRVLIKDAQNVFGVKHNYIYKLKVTLTGTGTPNPDENLLNAYLSVKIVVDPWKVVNQSEEDVN